MILFDDEMDLEKRYWTCFDPTLEMVHLTFEGMEMQISAAWFDSNWPEMPVDNPYTSNIHSLSALFLFSAKTGFERLHKLGGNKLHLLTKTSSKAPEQLLDGWEWMARSHMGN